MKKEIWQDKQKVLVQDLEHAQVTKEEAIKERFVDSFSPGVLLGGLNGFNFIPTIGYTDRFTVQTGIAYNPAGERIPLLNETIVYDPTLPLTQSDDGLGGFKTTAQSTGSKAILAVSGQVNYVFIKYLQTLDPLTFTLKKGSAEKLYTKAGDGYILDVVLSLTVVSDPETLNPDPSLYLYLGYVDYLLGGTITVGNFNLSKRKNWSISENRILVSTTKIDLSDKTTSYQASTVLPDVPFYVDLNDHVKAVGTGTVTPTNPHGMSFSDLGITGKSVEQHEQFLHESGIVGDQNTTSSSLYGVVNAISFPTLDELIVKGFITSEFVEINGITLGNESIAGTQIIRFKDGAINLADGTYTAYVNNQTKRIELAGPTGLNFTIVAGALTTILPVSNVSVLANANNFPIWQVDFTSAKIASNVPEVQFPSPANGFSNFTNKVDKRFFGNLGSDTIKVDSETDSFTLDHNLIVLGDNNIVPSGVVLPFAGPKANTPPFYLYCDSKLYDKDTYPKLFAAIGYSWGGDGVNFFRVPEGRGGFLRGVQDIPPFTFTADPGTDLVTTSSAHTYNRSAVPIRFTSAGTLPGGLSINTTYWVVWVSFTTFNVATTHSNAIAGVFLDITSAGTGTHTVYAWLDPDAAAREATAPGGLSGDQVGAWQSDEIRSPVVTAIGVGSAGAATQGQNVQQFVNSVSPTLSGGNETRPWNTGYTFIIKI